MDDFRVGSVPSSEAYGDRHPYGSIARKRQKHHDGQEGREQDETTDTFEATTEGDDSSATTSATTGEPVEDYYLPSGAPEDKE